MEQQKRRPGSGHERDAEQGSPGTGPAPRDRPTRPLGDDATRPDAPPRPRRDRSLPLAIASGTALVATLVGTVLWHPAAFTGLVLALALFGVVETGRVLREHGYPVSLPVLLAASVVVVVGAYRAGADGQVVGVATLFFGAVVWELADVTRREVFRKIAATLMLGLWLPFLGSYGALLVTRPEAGWVAVLATVGVAVTSDTAAYVVGTRYGRHRLAPTISPGKTWEGFLAGVAAAAALAVAVLPLLGSTDLFTPVVALGFAVAVAAAGAVGDLVESMVKRHIGVKDFGILIPGHGGILDRVDGILFALPTGFYALKLLGR